TIFMDNRKLNKVIVGLEAEHKKLDTELKKTVAEIAREPEVRERLEQVKEEVFLTNKTMYTNDDPTITLSYLFDIVDTYKNYLLFNYSIVASGTAEADNSVNYNLYSIEGTTYINLFYVFLDQLERQPSFYTVESVNLNMDSTEDFGMVSFNIKLKAYFSPDSTPIESRKLAKYKKRTLEFNPFYPRVHPIILPEDKEAFDKLVDCESAEIVALSRSSVFVRQGSLIRLLKIDDRVKFGQLESINFDKQEAVFTISKHGIKEYVYRRLQENLDK
ncbi:MAG: hypothetical protein PHR06_12645, partial [Candidatus Cloacimonetes bacterium]|nr:hypothetical protein [Candidatus Cloacimonadota bacterium]